METLFDLNPPEFPDSCKPARDIRPGDTINWGTTRRTVASVASSWRNPLATRGTFMVITGWLELFFDDCQHDPWMTAPDSLLPLMVCTCPR